MKPMLTVALVLLAPLAFAQAPASPQPASEAKAADAKVPDPTLSTLQGRILQPEKINSRMHELLRRKMRSHAKDYQSLPMAIVFANYHDIRKAAQGIMNEPRLDKASLGDDQGGLSDYFFQLQGELRERAGALHKASEERDVAVMTQALGKLTETCATCHLVFREPMKKAEAKK